MLRPAGRTGVECLAAGKLHTRNHKVQFVVPGVNVPHPEDIALIRLQPGKGQGLKIVHDALLLLRRHSIVGVPRQRPGGETPFAIQRVDERARHLRVAAQHIRQMGVASGVVFAHKVVGGAFARALAVREHFHIHGASSGAGGGAVSALTAFSRLTRAVSTSNASARALWVLAQRAS